MKELFNINEWLFANLDLIEECKEKKIKPIVFIAGASSSGKSFLSKQLKLFLSNRNYKSIIISTDNYNNGLAKNIVSIVDKKYFNGDIKNKTEIISKIKEIIENEDFDKKFCKENLIKIKNECSNLINVDAHTFLTKLAYEFENINFDNKKIYNLKELVKDLLYLASDKSIVEKQYSKLTSERVATNKQICGKDVDVIIVEGIYALDSIITDNVPVINQITNFVNCNNKHLFLRRIIRDSQITNCSTNFIIKNYIKFVSPEYQNSVLPTKDKAMIVLKNDMSFDELRQGKLSTQARYKISSDTLKKLLAKSTLIKKVYQEDIYFGKKDDQDILRLRLQGSNKNNATLKSLIYKGQQKTRKDKNLIRPMQVLCEQKDLLAMFKNKQEVLNAFSSIEILPYQTLCKERMYIKFKESVIKVDFYDNNCVYIELDEKYFKLLNDKHLKQVDPISQMQSESQPNCIN